MLKALDFCVKLTMIIVRAAQLIGAGLATISIAGTGAGIGSIFAALLTSYSRSPELMKQLFTYAILGFALC